MLVHMDESCVKIHPSWHGQCLSCVVTSLLSRYIVFVLIASAAISKNFWYVYLFYLKLETEDQVNFDILGTSYPLTPTPPPLPTIIRQRRVPRRCCDTEICTGHQWETE